MEYNNINSRIRIGTRGSKLAIAQALELQNYLKSTHEDLMEPSAIEVVVIKTTGDNVQDRPLAEIGGKGLFMKEIEEALLNKEIDLALHSMKDVETDLTKGTGLACILPREEINDAFISNKAQNIDELSAQGNGGMRQQHHYASLEIQNEIETPPDTYTPNKVGEVSIENLQQQRNNDIN